MHRTSLPASVQSKVVAVVNFGVSQNLPLPVAMLIGHDYEIQDPQQSSGSRGIPIDNVSCYYQYW